MDRRLFAKIKNALRTFSGYFVKIKFKSTTNFQCFIIVFLVLLNYNVSSVVCNKPPRFLIDGQTEIVLRLKEGEETPVGE